MTIGDGAHHVRSATRGQIEPAQHRVGDDRPATWDWTGGAQQRVLRHAVPSTPWLRRGLAFDGAWSTAATWCASRTSLLTGLHHCRSPGSGRADHAPLGDPLAMAEGVWTIAGALRDAGYETALMGRMHFDPMGAGIACDGPLMREHQPGQRLRARRDIDDYARWMASEGLPDWRVLDPVPGGVVAHLASTPRVFPADAEHHPTGWIEPRRSGSCAPAVATALFLVVSFPHPHTPYDRALRLHV